jgi:hypothetical protein
MVLPDSSFASLLATVAELAREFIARELHAAKDTRFHVDDTMGDTHLFVLGVAHSVKRIR